MASHKMKTNTLVFFYFFFFLFLSSPMDARKLLSGGEGKVATLDGALFLSALPKGRVPPSSPKNRGHGMGPAGERPSASHSTGINKRWLESVPSPGVGH